MQNKSNDNTVLIAGGGITGLCAALFLRQQGITPMLVERHKGVSIHPRARGFDVRTMELFRSLQLNDTIRDAGKALAAAWGIHTGRSLAAVLQHKKRRTEAAENGNPGMFKALQPLFDQSPEMMARCTQDLAEPVLLQAALQSGADIHFYTELVSFEQDADGVTALLKDRATGETRTVRAAYLLAADGAKSPIRSALQASTIGRGPIANLLNIYFEADLRAFVRGREFSIVRIDEADLKGMLCSINNADRWVFHLYYDPAKGQLAKDFTPEVVLPVLQRAIGLPDVPVRVISILPWQPTVKVVTEMQHGRVFLAGDAAHVMTPYGGKGANSGIQDVHNLAWKLAAVLKGQAAPALLHTYSTERQPLGWHYARSSGKMSNEYGLVKKVLVKFFAAFAGVLLVRALRLEKLFPRLPALQLGGLFGLPDYRYTSPAAGAVVSGTGHYQKAGAFIADPGTRMPHRWVTWQGRKVSTLDVVNDRFVLFTGEDNQAWKQAACGFAGIVNVFSIGPSGDLKFPEEGMAAIARISAQGAVLVRPDGFVAWKWKTLPAAPAADFKAVMARVFAAVQA